MAATDPDDASTLRLLLSTDNHLGYAEKDPVRGDDSFRTFQEILRLAQSESVDLLLLAGDLFHDAKPSRKTMYQTMSLLRTHCMGDGAVRFQIVSDQSINFPNFGVVNYEDPNYNIQLPVFSIHGNHDDPSREGGGSNSAQQSLAALDVLSAANFVNYFGKSDRVDAIEVFPILMVKGATRVAIYGLGNMRDERLNRMFAQQKVVFRRPVEHPDAWFSIFVVHQNRDDRGRGAKNCIPESFIPDFIDFVVWGHEHECLIDVQESVKGDFYITQPGSSVATSLVEGEAKPKQVAVLEIRGQDFRMTSRALQSVRPFKMSEVVLSDIDELDPNDPDVTDHIHALLEARVVELLQEAEEEQRKQPQTHPELKQVLVRLRVEHTGFPVLHNQRFGSRFVGKIANPNDILLFYRRKRDRVFALDDATGSAGVKGKKGSGAFSAPIRPTRLDTVTIEDILQRKLHLPDQKLMFLPEKPLSIALENYVVKNIPSALDEFVDTQLEETQRELASKLSAAKSKQDIVSAVEKKREQIDAAHLLDDEEAAEDDGDGATSAEPATAATASQPSDGFSQSLRAQSGRTKPTPDDSRSSRFGTPRRASPVSQTRTSIMDSMMDSDDDDDDATGAAAVASPPPKRQTKAPAARSRTTTAASKTQKAPPARAAAMRKKPTKAHDLSSDDDDDDDDAFAAPDDDDKDDDYELNDDDDGDDGESEQTQRRPVKSKSTAKKVAPSARKAPKKRLRQRSSDDDDDDDFGLLSDSQKPAPRKRTAAKPRATPTTKRNAQASQASGEINLCSSDDNDAPAPTTKRKPQPKISDLFQRQQQQQSAKSADDQDDVESDAEFTQLAQNPLTEGSQAMAGAAPTRRKLPLSMVAASQGSSQGGTGLKRDADATSAIRKGWGRSRR